MRTYSMPVDEGKRIELLHSLFVLDTPAEHRFDRLIEFAVVEFNVPIALISLVDHHRQWFKAKSGVTACETSRNVSFCAHAILQDDLMVIEDATTDPRFADNPLVVGPPLIRFYAGAVLRYEGASLGTFCIIDTKPRQLDEIEKTVMRVLAKVTVKELHARRRELNAQPGVL